MAEVHGEAQEIKLGEVVDVNPGWRRVVKLPVLNDEVCVLIHCEADGIFAIENVCPHYDTPLSDGRRRGAYIECSWHHWMIDIRTGECMHNPRIKTKTFPVIERDGSYVLCGSQK